MRYRREPVEGVATLSDEDARQRGADYLRQELRDRLTDGSAAFRLYLHLAGEGDDLTEPTTAWPADRPTVLARRLELTGVAADPQGGCGALIFDPANVTDGIAPSDDPILHARPRAYPVSYARRLAARAP